MSAAVLTAALTGPIATKADNPALPTSPEEIAAAARDSYEAGASVVHVHLRDADGLPDRSLDVARRVVGLIEESCPALVQLSTGVGLSVPYEERERLVEARPRMATLNVCSMSFGIGEFRNPPDGVRRLAARMRELGVKPELELYDSGPPRGRAGAASRGAARGAAAVLARARRGRRDGGDAGEPDRARSAAAGGIDLAGRSASAAATCR